MIEHIEFVNSPPTVNQCPALEMRLFARSLVAATKKWKGEQNESKHTSKLAESTAGAKEKD